MAAMEKQQSFQMRTVEKQQSFHKGVMEKQKSFHMGALEKQKSVWIGETKKQKSFQIRAMEKQQSFKEKKKSKDNSGRRGDSPLHLASRAGNLLRVREILSGGDDSYLKDLMSTRNQDGETALYLSAENGHAEVVHEILKCSTAESAAIKANNSFDALHIAAKHGNLDVLKELLSSFPELAMTTSLPNATALDTAATQGHIDVVNLLLETDASLAKIARNNGKTALHSAARMGHVEVVRSLLTKEPSIGFRPDKKGQTALHMAVKGNNVEIVQELLRPDLSIINVGDNKGNTPLHIAAGKGRSQIVQYLLMVEGIDVNAFNKAGETALDIAEKISNEEIISILREVGAMAAKEHANPPNPAKQLKQTVSDIKHDVQSQLHQTRKTGMRVQKIKKRLKKLHIVGLNNAINSNTVVAVLIATIAFAAIFTEPGQFIETKAEGYVGEAYIAKKAAFVIFLWPSSASHISWWAVMTGGLPGLPQQLVPQSCSPPLGPCATASLCIGWRRRT